MAHNSAQQDDALAESSERLTSRATANRRLIDLKINQDLGWLHLSKPLTCRTAGWVLVEKQLLVGWHKRVRGGYGRNSLYSNSTTQGADEEERNSILVTCWYFQNSH